MAGGRIVSPTYRLAEEIVSRLQNVEVWDGLRWAKAKPATHGQSGQRDPRDFYDNLKITKRLPKAEIVLVDDMCTSGAHMRGIRARIIEKHGKCRLGLSVGRAVSEHINKVFERTEQDLEDFNP